MSVFLARHEAIDVVVPAMTVCLAHHEAINALAEALNLPPRITEFTLHVKGGELVTLTMVQVVDPANICSLTKTIRKYELKEKE